MNSGIKLTEDFFIRHWNYTKNPIKPRNSGAEEFSEWDEEAIESIDNKANQIKERISDLEDRIEEIIH